MNILVLTKKITFPVKDGESVAIMNLARNFVLQGCNVSMLSMLTSKHYFRVEDIPGEMKNLIHFESVFVDTRISLTGILKNIYSTLPYHIQRFVSNTYSEKLRHLLTEKKFDVVQLEGLFLVPYIPAIRKYSNAKVVLRSHNIEAKIWERLAKNENNYFKKQFFSWQTKKLLLYEWGMLDRYDAVVPISLFDKTFYSMKKDLKVKYIPSGIEVNDNMLAQLPASNLYYLGALDWLPNIEGLQWFIEKIFPKVIETQPGVIFHIAGRNAGQYFKNLKKQNIIFHGEIEDAKTFLADKSICVVPLLSGSGMKIKILEALAHGKFVVTTSIGMEGFPPEVEKFCSVGDNENEFADNIIQALNNPETIANTGGAAIQYIREHFDNKKLTADLLQFYSTLT